MIINVTRHYKLPVSSDNSVAGTFLFKNGKIVTLYFDYYSDGSPRRSGIRFEGVAILQTRNERFSTGTNVSSFDTLTELHNSPWIAKIKGEIHTSHHAELDEFRHFSIYLDDAGVTEVLALDFKILPEEAGSWETLRLTTSY